MKPHKHSFSLQEAAQESPTMAMLTRLATESSERLRAIQTLLPAALRCAVRAGPIEEDVWCLVLDNNAVAAKMRQLLPALEAHLRSKGWKVNSIRLKVQTP